MFSVAKVTFKVYSSAVTRLDSNDVCILYRLRDKNEYHIGRKLRNFQTQPVFFESDPTVAICNDVL